MPKYRLYKVKKNVSHPSIPAMRVHQIESKRLEKRAISIIFSYFRRALSGSEYIETINAFQDDIRELLHLLHSTLTVVEGQPSIGMHSKCLQIVDLAGGVDSVSLSKRFLYGYFSAWAVWSMNIFANALEVYDDEIPTNSFSIKRLQEILKQSTKIVKVLQAVNTVLFLKEGKYITLASRFLNLGLEYSCENPLEIAVQEYNFDNDIVLKEYSKTFDYFWPMALSASRRVFSATNRAIYGAEREKEKLKEVQCPFCSEKPIWSPFKAKCGHVSCYYCVFPRLGEDCRVCGETLEGLSRVIIKS